MKATVFILKNIFITSVIVAIIFCPVKIIAQTPFLKGKIIDKDTRLPLEFVNVRLSGSNSATATDSSGRFTIPLEKLKTTLEISMVGYQQQKINTASIKNGNEILIELKPTAFSLQEVLIKPTKRKKREIDTVAFYILKQVQLHKHLNRPNSIPAYKFYEHDKLKISLLNLKDKFINSRFIKPFKFFFDSPDTTISGKKYYSLLMQEEYNETFHRASPPLNRKVVFYRKTSGFKGNKIANLLAVQFEPVDVYENVYVIAGKGFTSPFSPNAKLIYVYHVLDTIRAGGRVFYDLNFVARNNANVAVKGTAQIDSASWGIRIISFRPNQNSNVNFLTDYSIHQEFEFVDSGWILKKESVGAVGNLLEKQERIAVYVTKSTERDSLSTNFSFPDSVLKVKDDIMVKGFWKHPYTFLDSLRFTPLDSSELHIYKALDSANHVKEFKALKWAGNFAATGNMRAGPVDFGKTYQFLSRNAVEGYRAKLGVRTNEDFSTKVWLYGHVAYGFQDKQWKYALDARFALPSKYDRWHIIGVFVKNDMVMLGQANPLLSFDNIVTLFSGKKLNQVIRANLCGLTYEVDWFKGLSSTVSFKRTHYVSMPKFYNFQTESKPGILTNIPGFYTNEISADLRYCKTELFFSNYGYRFFIPSKLPSVSLRYTLGFRNVIGEGGYNYHKIETEVKHLLYTRVAGYAYITLIGGYMLGNVPYTAAYISSSNLSIFKDKFSYQLTQPYEFISDKYVSLWYEHHFEGALLNYIPYIKKLKLREMVSVKTLWGNFSDTNRNLVTPMANSRSVGKVPYIEVAFGIENILKLFQINFIWRVTHRYTPGSPNFGVKIAIVPSF